MICIPPNPRRVGYIDSIHGPLDGPLYMGSIYTNTSPYYAQANGQAESNNKILIKLIKKKIEENRGGMRYYLKHCGLIVYLDMVLLKLLLLSLFMVKRPFYR